MELCVFFGELLVCLLKIFITFKLVLYFGIIKAFLVCYLIFRLYKFLVFRIFGLALANLDTPLIGYNRKEKYTLEILLNLEDFDNEKIKELIIERGIKKIPKLRSILVYRLFNYYWKEITNSKLDDYIAKVFITSEIEEKTFLEYANKELQNDLDILSNKKFPYEIHLLKFKGKTNGAILFKIDHVLSDGLGLVSMICAIADNYSEELFPAVMRGIKPSYFQFVFDILFFPYYFFILSFSISLNKPQKTPFKKMFISKSGPQHSGKTKFTISKPFPLKRVDHIKKSLKISFNDLIVCLVLFVFKKKFPDVNNMNFVLASGKTGIPKNIEEVELLNKSGGLFLELPLIENFEKDAHKISKILTNKLKNKQLNTAPSITQQLILQFLPLDILNIVNNAALQKIDLILSNVPGPTNPIFYAGSKVIDLIPIVSNGRSNCFLPVFSYNKCFRFVLSYDENLQLDPNDLIRDIELTIDELVQHFNNRS